MLKHMPKEGITGDTSKTAEVIDPREGEGVAALEGIREELGFHTLYMTWAASVWAEKGRAGNRFADK